MQSVSIQTTQNISIDYPLASIGDRIFAYLIDSLVIGVYLITIFFLLAAIEYFEPWLIILFLLPSFFYHLVCEILLEGQSIGKRQMKIKVVKLDGSPAGIGAYVIRWMLRLIDNSLFYGGVAMVCIAAGGKGQRLGDMAAGTTVIKLKKRVGIANDLMVDQTPDDYEVVFGEVAQLNDKQVEIIRKTLRAYEENANQTPAEKLTQKIKEMLNIEPDLPPVQFLHTVVKDYNHITSRS